ncbi:MAG: hypothetical protein U0T36_03320 [Saprospiraceae bacterium]
MQAFNGSVSNTITLPIFVNLVEPPVAEFVYNINGLVVNFIYTGTGATSYSWTFAMELQHHAQTLHILT